MNMPVYSTEIKEEACHGAAILAGVGVGLYPNIKEACETTIQMSPVVIEPIAENVKVYNEKHQIFHDFYFSVKDLYPRIR